MKFTIQSYRKTSLPKSGKTVYPFAGFYKNQLKFGFDRQGPMVIRCQILEAGTSTEAKIKVKIPVWDIDDAQFVGKSRITVQWIIVIIIPEQMTG